MPTLADIAAALGVPAPADGERRLTGIAALDDAGPTELAYVSSESYARRLPNSRCGAVIVQRKIKLPADFDRPVFPVDDAELAVAKALALFAPPIARPPRGVDPAARVAASAQIGDDVAIGPFVVIGERARVGSGTVLHAGVFIGDDTIVGDQCEFFPHVTIRERIEIGHRVVIHANSALGADGFGYRWDGRQHVKIPQIGVIVVEDDVEIGSCVCVDRAKFGATRIGRGTKIDNLVQVAHNVRIGPHCIIIGQAGMAGSVTLGAGVVIGGQTAVRDHIAMGDGAMAAACSAIADDVPPKSVVSGTPALPHRQSLREQAALRRLPDLVVQVRKLMEEIEAIQGGGPK